VPLLGWARLDRKLKHIPRAAADQIEAALIEGGEEIAALAKSLVHERSGALKDSIGACIGEPPPTSATGAFRPRKVRDDPMRPRVSVYAGNDDAYYARWEEFGTQAHSTRKGADISRGKRQGGRSQHPGTQAHPFFFPAYRALKRRVKAKTMKAVRKAAQITAALK
jgi:HK97 gp10 family phage protein